MKKILYLIIVLGLFVLACNNEETPSKKGKSCVYYTECQIGEICLNQECIPAEDYNCVKNNEKCPTDLICMTLSHTCKPEECNKHSDCSQGQFCNIGVCKTGCKNDTECGKGYTCNQSTGECDLKTTTTCLTNPEICNENQDCNPDTGQCVDRETKECINDFECDYEHGQFCNLTTNKCEMDPNYCEHDSDCQTNFECKAHHCDPIGGQECLVDEECDNGLHCNNGEGGTNTCVQCLEDAHCTDGYCDLNSKRCIIEQSCTDDSTCPEGTKCVMPDGMMPGMGGGMPGTNTQGTCQEVEVCYIDADCNPEGTDPENYEKYCKRNQGVEETEPGYCATKNNFSQDDLTSGFLDSLGICIPNVLDCKDDAECIVNDGEFIGHCEGGSGGNCNDPLGLGRQQCESNGGHCNAEGECVGAAEPECYRDSDCAELYPDRENLICQRGGCMEDPTPRCQQESDCTEQMHCDTNEGICYTCVTDSHCGNNSVCRDHNCVNSSFCTSDSDCPDGTQCRANICR